MHATLTRQLKRVLDRLPCEAQMIEFDQMQAFLQANGAPPILQKIADGLPDFLRRVEQTYVQFERDLNLRTRSLQISSEEFIKVNTTLHEELIARENAISELKLLVSHLQQDVSNNDEKAPTNDLALLVKQVSTLVHRQEAQQSELQHVYSDLANQKYALDQHAIVSMTDLQGSITYANDRFCDISGYSREELVGSNHRIVRSNEHPPSVFEALWATIAAGKVWNGEVKNRKKNGQFYWVSATIVPLLDQNGQPAQYIAIRTDITQRKRTEKALQEAKTAAEAASRAKSDFLANMSHEIRTPMNGIIGMTELTLDTELDPTQRDYLNIVRSSADALLVILNDILDFSKIEAGKLTIEIIGFNLPVTITESLKSIAARAQKKGLTLVIDIPADLPTIVEGDPGRIRQVLNNLCDNAIKFTHEGSITIRAESSVIDGDDCMVTLSITDMGIGIPKDKQAQIFQAFTQADASTTRQFGGTGLGLTISARLVQLMNGAIWVESEPGVGSTFHFSVRLKRCRLSDGTRQPLPLLTLWEGLSALVVDDHPINRRSLSHWLHSWGFRVEEAKNGIEALEKCQKSVGSGDPYHLIILDAHMPLLDGFGFAAALKAQSLKGPTQLVMLSSGGGKGDSQRCRELGIAGYLTKPATPIELRETLTRILAPHAVDSPSLPTKERSFVTRHSLKEQQRQLNILVVEDNPVNQKLVTLLLGKMGHQVTLAHNGQEAVDRFPTSDWDVVLMDIQMPVMGGLEATRIIRQNEASGQRTPIIAMTANAMVSDSEDCLAAGMDEHLPKPINVKVLQGFLNHFCARAGVLKSR